MTGLSISIPPVGINITGGPGDTIQSGFTINLTDITTNNISKYAEMLVTGPGLLRFITNIHAEKNPLLDYANVFTDSADYTITLDGQTILFDSQNINNAYTPYDYISTDEYSIRDTDVHVLGIEYYRTLDGNAINLNLPDVNTFSITNLTILPFATIDTPPPMNGQWTFQPTNVNDIVSVIGKDGISDAYNENTVLRKVNKLAATALKITDTKSGLPATITSTVFPATINFDIIIDSTVIPVVVDSTVGNGVTVGDIVNRCNTLLRNHGAYCALEVLNSDYKTTGIVFYSYNNSPLSLFVDLVINYVGEYSINIEQVSLPNRDIWEILGDSQASTFQSRKGSNELDNMVVPKTILRSQGSAPQSYCVQQPSWQRTGDNSRPPLDSDEIVNIKWALSYEILRSSTSKIFGDAAKVLLTFIKASPGRSMIDFNNPSFMLQLITELESADVLSGYLRIGPAPSRPTEPIDNAQVKDVPEINGIGNVVAFILYNNIVVFAAIPKTGTMLSGNFSGIPVNQGDVLSLYIPVSSIEPWVELDFTNSIIKFNPAIGVYNLTGLNNYDTYSYAISGDIINGGRGITSPVYTAYSNDPYNKVDATTLTTGGRGVSVASAANFVVTHPNTGSNSNNFIGFYINGPGVFSATCSITGGTVNDTVHVYINDTAVFTRTGNQAPATYTTTLAIQEVQKISLHSFKTLTGGSNMIVTWSNVTFIPSSIAPTITNLPISSTDYNTYNDFSINNIPYDVTTIKGLINAINGIYGPHSNNPAQNIVTAGWSFGGKMIIQHRYKVQNFSIYSTGTTNPLLNLGVTIASMGVSADVNNIASIDTNLSNVTFGRGITMNIPLLPSDYLRIT